MVVGLCPACYCIQPLTQWYCVFQRSTRVSCWVLGVSIALQAPNAPLEAGLYSRKLKCCPNQATASIDR